MFYTSCLRMSDKCTDILFIYTQYILQLLYTCYRVSSCKPYGIIYKFLFVVRLVYTGIMLINAGTRLTLATLDKFKMHDANAPPEVHYAPIQ